MAFIGTVRIKASKDVQAWLKDLPPKVVKGHMRKALRAGAKVIQDEAQKRAPVGNYVGGGKLKKQIKIRAAKSKSKWAARMKVQIVGTGQEGDAFYGTMVESGTVERVQKKTGRRTGKVVGREFLHGAFNDRKSQAEDLIAESLADAVKSEQ
jgi:HK97 gp10 family phage protein